ncbi:MAG: carotenoid oxygenase family protein [Acidimicrobiales bacterium]
MPSKSSHTPRGLGPDHAWRLANLDHEYTYWLDDIEGTVPVDLEGTFVRNGPGRQRIGDTPYGHWFDGDGMLSVFSIADGRVHFANRYVRTPKYLKETAEQKICYRGFGTQIPRCAAQRRPDAR